jgi:uncharacterized membrane protein
MTSLLPMLTPVLLAIHVGAGIVGLVAGTVAAFARKGSRSHRAAGTVFVASMFTTALLACYLAVVLPGQIVNVFIAIFTIYLISTGWLTVRRGEGVRGIAEKIALPIALILCAPFAILSFQLATGMTPMFRSVVPLVGPVRIAIYVLTTILAIATIGDAKVVFGGGIAGAPRIARHLWRMCLGLGLAAGSAFTNGFARLLPGPYHVPPAFFLPQFLRFILLVFRMIRVRFTGWWARDGAPTTTATVRAAG